jgi:hypothetical protein
LLRLKKRRGRPGEELPGCEEGLAEVAGDDFFFVADGGEVDSGVPAPKYIDVRRYILKLGFGEASGFLAMKPLGMTTCLAGLCDRAGLGGQAFDFV